MNPRLAHLLVRLYPRPWRDRYGAEFEAFLIASPGGLREFVNILWAALHEHIFPTRGRTMDQDPNSFRAILKHPSAFLPLAMSLTALSLVVGHVTIYGAAREADEGTAAHLWQLLMAGQLPVIAFFAIKWLPRSPRQTLHVLGLQAGAVLASMAPVLYLGL